MSDTKIGECDSCGFENIEVREYRAPPFREEQGPKNFCDVCAGSFISNATNYPNLYELDTLYRSLGYCTNLILKAIKDSQGRTTP